MMPTFIVYTGGNFAPHTLYKLADKLGLYGDVHIADYGNDGWTPHLWSARLSTGLFGLANCPSGNKEDIPKGPSDVILGIGDEGLQKFIDLGFITCPVCKPETIKDFWEEAKDTIADKYGLDSLADFTNKKELPYDIRRVNYEAIMPNLEGIPNRLYLPKGLSQSELHAFRKRWLDMGNGVPPMGYYDKDAKNHFTTYLF